MHSMEGLKIIRHALNENQFLIMATLKLQLYGLTVLFGSLLKTQIEDHSL